MLSDTYRYVTLDDNQALSLALDDPALFFRNHVPPVVVDEVQYAQSLFRQIKVQVDGSDRKGTIVLTGSQTFHLMQDVTESLAGRIAILQMSGLSWREIAGVDRQGSFMPEDSLVGEVSGLNDVGELWRRIHRGSMPELQNPDIEWGLYYSNYVRTYIERDVRSLIGIKDENLFYKFLVALAARTGQLFNASSVADDVGVTLKTIQQWTAVLETSGVVHVLRPYFTNVSKGLIKTPKLYFMDCGLACYLAGWTTPEVLEKGAMAGAMFETFVVSEILKSVLNAGEDLREVSFYRDTQKREIDLVLRRDAVVHPVEIKLSATPHKNMVRSFRVLDGLGVPVGTGALICLADKSGYVTTNVITIPVDLI
ncbi:MAG: ATP-binding protein [Propionibacteriaceae bacterium]|nr:ATP-binding protein [Propionibacteriaceae bacterium]